MKQKRKKELKHHYSGAGAVSCAFWNEVRSIKRQPERDHVYSLGVLLQNLETETLRALQVARVDE